MKSYSTTPDIYRVKGSGPLVGGYREGVMNPCDSRQRPPYFFTSSHPLFVNISDGVGFMDNGDAGLW